MPNTTPPYFCPHCQAYRTADEATLSAIDTGLPARRWLAYVCPICWHVLSDVSDGKGAEEETAESASDCDAQDYPLPSVVVGTLAAANRNYLVEQIMVLVEGGIEVYGEHLDAGAPVAEAVVRSLADAREDVREWVGSFAASHPGQEADA